MLKRCFLTVCVCGATFAALAETIELKDSSSITGTILANKADSVAVDVGYTVLVIPRSQILKIDDTAPVKVVATAKGTNAVVAPIVASKPGFYTSGLNNPTARSVRDLVKEIGEAVVQVRTPEGHHDPRACLFL